MYTSRVESQAVQQSGFQHGTVTIFVLSTSAVTTIEFGPGVNDLRLLFDGSSPTGPGYQHDAAWHDGNGSQPRAALLGPSLISFVDQRLTPSTWQQIIYIDFDNRLAVASSRDHRGIRNLYFSFSADDLYRQR
jgi:thiamine phosphate synthase YjbQ (UPF0047 family)